MIHLLQRLLFVLVMVPALLVSFYIGQMMSDRYATNAGIMIKRQAETVSVGGIGAALGLGDAAATEDERILLAYIQSPDLLRLLDDELGLREHYSYPEIDWFSRLPEDASREDFLKYFQSKVAVREDSTTGLLNIEVQAFDPEMSYEMMLRIMHHSESFVKEISMVLAEQQLAFIQQELDRAQAQLREENDALVRFQSDNQTFSPQGQSQALSGVINSLESELVREETQLSQLESYLNPNAPQIVSTKARIDALNREIERQRGRLGGESGQNLIELNVEYANLELNREFAANMYTTTLSSFEQARAETSRKLRNMVTVTSPQVADEGLYPNRTYWIITWLLGALLVYAVLKLILSIIREHVD